MTQRKLIGHCDVDSGNIFITDPCYIKKHPELFDEDKWNKFCNIRDENDFEPQEILSGICVYPRFGDGSYPVYVHFDEEGKVKKMEIEF